MIAKQTDYRVITVIHPIGEVQEAPQTDHLFLRTMPEKPLDEFPGQAMTVHFYDPNVGSNLGNIVTHIGVPVTHLGVPVTHTPE